MVFAFPWLWGLPLAFLRARGARRGGYCSRVVGSDVSRLRASLARRRRVLLRLSVALALGSQFLCGLRAEG